MFVSAQTFLNQFHHSNTNITNFDDFMKHAKVKSKKEIIPLLTYIKNKKMKKTDFRKLYDHYVHKDDYLNNFYNYSLKLPDQLAFSEKPMKSKFDNVSFSKYKDAHRSPIWLYGSWLTLHVAAGELHQKGYKKKDNWDFHISLGLLK